MIYLETDRLRLRGWRKNDLQPFAALCADQRVMKYYPAVLSTEQSADFIERQRRSLEENGFGWFALESKSVGGLIGYAGLSRVGFTAAFTPAVEIGWRLAFPAWGRGYATEAALGCLDFGFSKLGLTEIVAFTTRGNRRSIAVMERIGMSRNTADDFERESLPDGHPLRPHILYRIGAPA